MAWEKTRIVGSSEYGSYCKTEYTYTRPLTRKDALEMCIDMWEGLARSGNNYKPDTNLKADCALCEYSLAQCADEEWFSDYCDLCPVVWDRIDDGSMFYCHRQNSLYNLWRRCDDKEVRRELAAGIVDLARKELEVERKREENPVV